MLDRIALTIIRDVRQRHGDGDVILCLELLLEARHNWLNSPDPTLWKTGDAHRLLIDTAAPRLTDLRGLTEHGATALRMLVDFLDETDRFHPGSMRAAALRRELDRAAAKFPAAMADESVWRLAKRLYAAMLAEGVDIEDDAAVDAWATTFNAAPAQRRRAVLGVLLDRQPELLTARFVIRDSQVAAISPGTPTPPQFLPDDTPPLPQPPISLPPLGELADRARESAWLRKMVVCGHWAAGGRKVTKSGFPTGSDTRAFGKALGVSVRADVRDPRGQVPLIRAWRTALDVEVLRLHRTEVVTGPGLVDLERILAGEADPETTLAIWKDVLDVAISRSGPQDASDDDHRILVEFMAPWGPRALGELYRIEGEVDLDDLIDDLIDDLVDDYLDPSAADSVVSMTGVAVRTRLLAPFEAGAITVTTSPEAESEFARRTEAMMGVPAWSALPIPGTRVTLTPLGRYFVRENLLAEGTEAPLLPAGS